MEAQTVFSNQVFVLAVSDLSRLLLILLLIILLLVRWSIRLSISSIRSYAHLPQWRRCPPRAPPNTACSRLLSPPTPPHARPSTNALHPPPRHSLLSRIRFCPSHPIALPLSTLLSTSFATLLSTRPSTPLYHTSPTHPSPLHPTFPHARPPPSLPGGHGPGHVT